ncbi:MAG TPA: NAD(P)H-dependent oxidoreductase subunit E [Holophaga sp.]|nr:NAD(P)H-dependent oxidoreductase subunit E [Holophaga sp.]
MTEERAATLREAPAVDLAAAREILDRMHPVRPGDLIPLLQKLQGAYGYLPADVLHEVSAATAIPLSRMYGVITFYSQFSTSPRGRHTVRVCSGTACHVKGSRELLEAIHHEIGVEDNGSTTDGRFTLETVACLGTCFLAPVMMVNDEYFGSLSPAQARAILKNYA